MLDDCRYHADASARRATCYCFAASAVDVFTPLYALLPLPLPHMAMLMMLLLRDADDIFAIVTHALSLPRCCCYLDDAIALRCRADAASR